MRVIAGTSKGRRLATFEGRNVRPTPDRVREALFSILQSKLGGFDGLNILDLYAGSGALAIESLSRGAKSACLIEKAHSSVQIIRENLDRCHFSDRAELVTRDVLQAIPSLEKNSYDVIFLDPPYGQGLAERSIEEIGRCELLRETGILCAETGAKENLPDSTNRLEQIEQRRYGSIMISLYTYLDDNEGRNE